MGQYFDVHGDGWLDQGTQNDSEPQSSHTTKRINVDQPLLYSPLFPDLTEQLSF
ncbi:hypothetical protein PAXRUDRAFT_826882 [Paxillus rubicundulus Ve08.2h10]|uniref:Uncharacterized protein n=1 Tax=Paxillus rubicundulus Ve08.2h10 TaxID=930991 RepID=A0A0D0E3Q6_9AGAM|nr:hypothetical protein PAXRUDRAFT_826882 [Paxillus rubicundulus Ve08.2h10]